MTEWYDGQDEDREDAKPEFKLYRESYNEFLGVVKFEQARKDMSYTFLG